MTSCALFKVNSGRFRISKLVAFYVGLLIVGLAVPAISIVPVAPGGGYNEPYSYLPTSRSAIQGEADGGREQVAPDETETDDESDGKDFGAGAQQFAAKLGKLESASQEGAWREYLSQTGSGSEAIYRPSSSPYSAAKTVGGLGALYSSLGSGLSTVGGAAALGTAAAAHCVLAAAVAAAVADAPWLTKLLQGAEPSSCRVAHRRPAADLSSREVRGAKVKEVPVGRLRCRCRRNERT
eukprot:GHVU01083936.1.p1 GENE.GHVU01083936.1~~GHVU01083936.1.p1  ORF type:complete len:238 (+),score=23.99 GHVU01083936.1:295-1008(+)